MASKPQFMAAKAKRAKVATAELASVGAHVPVPVPAVHGPVDPVTDSIVVADPQRHVIGDVREAPVLPMRYTVNDIFFDSSMTLPIRGANTVLAASGGIPTAPWSDKLLSNFYKGEGMFADHGI